METRQFSSLSSTVCFYLKRRNAISAPSIISRRQYRVTSPRFAEIPPMSKLKKLPTTSLFNLGGSLRDTKSSQEFDAMAAVRAFEEEKAANLLSHHLHVFSSKHNTHITLTRPDRQPIMSLSTGNIGFKKAARGTYDAAYQLGAYVMNRIQQQGLLMTETSKEPRLERLELVLRGFGEGREAMKKILLGSEGMFLRYRIVKVTDSTRLKFGGERSKKPRRLG